MNATKITEALSIATLAVTLGSLPLMDNTFGPTMSERMLQLLLILALTAIAVLALAYNDEYESKAFAIVMVILTIGFSIVHLVSWWIPCIVTLAAVNLLSRHF